ncbi:hypothetical protein [Frondihabitans cladoniiphilus]|uniref:Tetratricopeptide repeat protein n=1 Tax=Frondihabitans cladoniiphilus TaxID=715785 RepID=A0ABP8VMN9_9MICO
MSTGFLPEVRPPAPPEHIEPLVEVPEALAAYRARLRRRLVLGSLPVVILVLLVAVKLLSLPVGAAVAQTTYDTKSYDSSVAASDSLGVVNVLEPWVRYFDRGTALAQIGVLTDARTAFEASLSRAPSGDTGVQCRILTDLSLVVEQQGDSAVLDQDTTAAEGFYAHALALIKSAPTGCFSDPKGGSKPNTAKPLQDEQGRLEQKQKAQQDGGGTSGGSQQGGSGSSGQGQSGSGQSGSGQGSSGDGSGDSSQSPLDKLKQQNGQAQQDQQQNDDRTRDFSQNPEDYSGKPW